MDRTQPKEEGQFRSLDLLIASARYSGHSISTDGARSHQASGVTQAIYQLADDGIIMLLVCLHQRKDNNCLKVCILTAFKCL